MPHADWTGPYAAPRPGVPPLADVYLPTGDGPHPCVLVVHGGGWVVGWRRMPAVRAIAQDLQAAGFAVCAPDYRKVFRGGDFLRAVHDVQTALRWWRGRADEHGLDLERLSVVGLSAGAATAVCATQHERLERQVLVYGPHDFERLPVAPRLCQRVLLGGTQGDMVRRLMPLSRATNPVPTLLIHGTDDRLVDVHHSHALLARRTALGLPTELILEPGQGHGWLNWPDTEVSRRTLAQVRQWVAGRAPQPS